jgi:hypothetical protein
MCYKTLVKSYNIHTFSEVVRENGFAKYGIKKEGHAMASPSLTINVFR